MSEVDGQGFFELLQYVYASGQTYCGDAPVIMDWDSTGKCSERRVDFTYAPVFDRKGLVTHIAVEGRLTKYKSKPVDDLCERIGQFGVGALSDMELLGLFCPDGGEDQAAALLQKFGSLKALLEASSNPLANGQEGGWRCGGPAEILPKRIITRLHLANELNNRVLMETLRERPLLSSSQTLHAYLRANMAGMAREQFCVFFLDSQLKLIQNEVINEGTNCECAVYPREIVRRALELSAHAVILVHNHPAHTCTASQKDRALTRAAVTAAAALDIAVLDHLIVAGQEIVSIHDSYPSCFDKP
jgi:DNA repair protein RadC